MEIISYYTPCPAPACAAKHSSARTASSAYAVKAAAGDAAAGSLYDAARPLAAGQSESAFRMIRKCLKTLRRPLCIMYGALCVCGAGILLISYLSRTAPVVELAYLPPAELETLNMAMSDFVVSMVEHAGSEAIPEDMLDTLKPVYTEPVSYSQYRVVSGDTISGITYRFGLKNISTLISVNEIDNTRLLRSGQLLTVPSMDGVLHVASADDSLAGISARYGVPVEDILDVNDLAAAELSDGQRLFIPGAVMDSTALRKALGELFAQPLSAAYRISSYFGRRADPFTGVASSHTGVDMAVSAGTPIYAAMSGKIAAVGFTNVYGNYVIINHENGYQTLYAHMLRKAPVSVGQRVAQGEQIGLVGSTGYSTGPHLHFTVYKNGKLIDPLSVLK